MTETIVRDVKIKRPLIEWAVMAFWIFTCGVGLYTIGGWLNLYALMSDTQ